MPCNVDFINGGAQGFTIENDVAIILSQSGGPSDFQTYGVFKQWQK